MMQENMPTKEQLIDAIQRVDNWARHFSHSEKTILINHLDAIEQIRQLVSARSKKSKTYDLRITAGMIEKILEIIQT